MTKQLTAVALLTLVAGTAMAAPRESRTASGPFNVWGASMAPESFTLNFTGVDGTPYQATRVIFQGTLTSNVGGTWPSDTSMDITPPDGATVTVLVSGVNGGYTSLPVSVNKGLLGPVNPNGTWTFTPFDTFEDGDGTTPEAILTDITVTLDDTPPATNTTPAGADNLGALTDGTTVTRFADVPAGGTLWYKWTSLDTTTAAGRRLTLSTEATTAGDSEIGCFAADGTFIASNDDFGGLRSRLSFGSGGLNGDLPGAGEYYGALSTYNANFASGFSVDSTGPGGSFQLDVTQAFVGDPRPVADDLGTLVDGVQVARDITVPAQGVVWLKANIADCSTAAGRSLTLSTLESGGGDSMIAIYNNDGTGIVYNDDANGTLLSNLVMGRGGFADLAAGTYYFAVTTYPTTFYIASWNVVSTGPGGSFHFTALQTNSFPPVAVGAATGTASGQLLTVTVTPGVNPDSTGIAVTGDLSELGGASNAAFHDDGLNGDAVAGDNVFSLVVANPAGGSDGQSYNVNWTVTDQQSNNVTGTITFGVDTNSMLTNATMPEGSGPLDSIAGTFDYANDVDMYLINICDAGSFTATTVGGTTADTQLFLFDSAGMGVSSDDDDPSTGVLQSTVTGTYVVSSGNYYLAVTRYNIDPADASGQLIWANTPFNAERQPDGPGAGGAFDHWTGAAFGTAEYTVNFTGACHATNNTQCSAADVGMAGGLAGHDRLLNNNDFIAFITLFFANDPQADMGVAGGLPGSDNQWNNNDFIAFIGHFFNDAANCNG